MLSDFLSRVGNKLTEELEITKRETGLVKNENVFLYNDKSTTEDQLWKGDMRNKAKTTHNLIKDVRF